MSRRKTDAISGSPTASALAAQPRNVAVGFPGIGNADCPYSIAGGTQHEDALEEVAVLLSAISGVLQSITDRSSQQGDVVNGCVFMVDAALAMVESVRRSGNA